MSAELVVPSTRDLEALSPKDWWDLEDALDGAQDHVRELIDAKLRYWVEVEGKTQTEIAELVGRSQSRISRRCTALGLTFPKGKGTAGGRPRAEVMPPHNPEESEHEDEGEVVDGEIVDDEEPEEATAPAPTQPRYEACPTCGQRVRADKPLRRAS